MAPSDPLLDPSKMDGPKIPFTGMDLVFQNSKPKLGMVYHVATAGCTVGTPVGAVLGGVVGSLLFRATPLIRVVANGGLILGAVGAAAGLAGMRGAAAKGETASPPWNDEGLQQRIDGLSHNYKVRALDLGFWAGIGVASLATVAGFRPRALGLLQTASMGVALGGVSSIAFLVSTVDRSPPVVYSDSDE